MRKPRRFCRQLQMWHGDVIQLRSYLHRVVEPKAFEPHMIQIYGSSRQNLLVWARGELEPDVAQTLGLTKIGEEPIGDNLAREDAA